MMRRWRVPNLRILVGIHKAGGDTQSGHFRFRAHERTVVEPELFFRGEKHEQCVLGEFAKKSSQLLGVFFSRLVKHAMIQLLQLNTFCLAQEPIACF